MKNKRYFSAQKISFINNAIVSMVWNGNSQTNKSTMQQYSTSS